MGGGLGQVCSGVGEPGLEEGTAVAIDVRVRHVPERPNERRTGGGEGGGGGRRIKRHRWRESGF